MNFTFILFTTSVGPTSKCTFEKFSRQLPVSHNATVLVLTGYDFC